KLLYDKRDFAKAEDNYRKLVESGNKVFGKSHPYVMTFKNNLAACLLGLKNYDDAERLFMEVLPFFEKIGPEHDYTLVVKSNIAVINLEKQNYAEAIRLYQILLPSFRKRFSEARSNTWNVMSGLAQAYFGDKQYDLCIETCQKLLVLIKSHLSNP